MRKRKGDHWITRSRLNLKWKKMEIAEEARKYREITEAVTQRVREKHANTFQSIGKASSKGKTKVLSAC